MWKRIFMPVMTDEPSTSGVARWWWSQRLYVCPYTDRWGTSCGYRSMVGLASGWKGNPPLRLQRPNSVSHVMSCGSVDAAQASGLARFAHHALSRLPGDEVSFLVPLILFSLSLCMLSHENSLEQGYLQPEMLPCQGTMRATTRKCGSNH